MSENKQIQAPPVASFRKAGSTVYLSGQVGVHSNWIYVEGDFETEARQVFENVKNVLSSAGLSMKNVITVRGFITDFDNFSEFNRIWSEYFPDNAPARTMVKAELYPPFRLELEVIAEER